MQVLRREFEGADERDRRLINSALHLGVVMDPLKTEFAQGDFLIRNVMGIQRESNGLAIGEVLREGQVAAVPRPGFGERRRGSRRDARESRRGPPGRAGRGRAALLLPRPRPAPLGKPDHDTDLSAARSATSRWAASSATARSARWGRAPSCTASQARSASSAAGRLRARQERDPRASSSDSGGGPRSTTTPHQALADQHSDEPAFPRLGQPADAVQGLRGPRPYRAASRPLSLLGPGPRRHRRRHRSGGTRPGARRPRQAALLLRRHHQELRPRRAQALLSRRRLHRRALPRRSLPRLRRNRGPGGGRLSLRRPRLLPAAAAGRGLSGDRGRGVGSSSWIVDAPATLVFASTYWRNSWKYQSRAYRHMGWDSGTMLANLLAVAAASELRAGVVAGFTDGPIETLLGLDPQWEGTAALVPIGQGAGSTPTTPDTPPLDLKTAPLSRSMVDYPKIRELHAASSLVTPEEAAAWRGDPPPRHDPPPARTPVALKPLPSQRKRARTGRGSSRRSSSGAGRRAPSPASRSISSSFPSAWLRRTRPWPPISWARRPGR